MNEAGPRLAREHGYIPGLDGIRAIAIVLVMLFHARFPHLPGAFAGVDIFFVLGGYLITGLLYDEFRSSGRIDLQAFYVRRIGRLVPALLAMLLVYVVVAPWAWPGANHWLQASLSMLGLADYTRAFLGIPLFLTHTWSLAVEHHFYLLWPLLIPWVLRSRRPLWLLGSLYLVAWAWRVLCLQAGQDWGQLYYRFDTRLSGLVLGAFLAVLLYRAPVREWLVRHRRYLLSSVLLIAAWMASQRWKDASFWVVGLPLLEVSVAMLVGGAAIGAASLRWLGWSWMRFIGKISYGLYLWHYPVFYFLRERHGWETVVLAGGGLAFCMACLSWWTVERWGHVWRRRWLQRRRTRKAERLSHLASAGEVEVVPGGSRE